MWVLAGAAGTDLAIEVPNGWVLKTRERRKSQRPDALFIKPTEKLSFADILRKVRNAPELKSVGDDVHLVKKTQKGEILLELNRTLLQRLVNKI